MKTEKEIAAHLKLRQNEIIPEWTKAYQEGKFDYLNLLDAQRTLFDVKKEYIESLAAYHAARIDVERLIGQGIDTVKTTHK